MSWNVAKIDVNVVVDELSSQTTIYTCLIVGIWTQWRHAHQRGFCVLVPSAQNGGLLVKLAPKVFDFTMDTPSSPESA